MRGRADIGMWIASGISRGGNTMFYGIGGTVLLVLVVLLVLGRL
jgi:hypothetical protein